MRETRSKLSNENRKVGVNASESYLTTAEITRARRELKAETEQVAFYDAGMS